MAAKQKPSVTPGLRDEIKITQQDYDNAVLKRSGRRHRVGRYLAALKAQLTAELAAVPEVKPNARVD